MSSNNYKLCVTSSDLSSKVQNCILTSLFCSFNLMSKHLKLTTSNTELPIFPKSFLSWSRSTSSFQLCRPKILDLLLSLTLCRQSLRKSYRPYLQETPCFLPPPAPAINTSHLDYYSIFLTIFCFHLCPLPQLSLNTVANMVLLKYKSS